MLASHFWGPEFASLSLHVDFMMDETRSGRFLSDFLQFSSTTNSIPPFLHGLSFISFHFISSVLIMIPCTDPHCVVNELRKFIYCLPEWDRLITDPSTATLYETNDPFTPSYIWNRVLKNVTLQCHALPNQHPVVSIAVISHNTEPSCMITGPEQPIQPQQILGFSKHPRIQTGQKKN